MLLLELMSVVVVVVVVDPDRNWIHTGKINTVVG